MAVKSFIFPHVKELSHKSFSPLSILLPLWRAACISFFGIDPTIHLLFSLVRFFFSGGASPLQAATCRRGTAAPTHKHVGFILETPFLLVSIPGEHSEAVTRGWAFSAMSCSFRFVDFRLFRNWTARLSTSLVVLVHPQVQSFKSMPRVDLRNFLGS